MTREPLTEIDRRKGDLLAQVSHELRTPLTSIRNFADLMRRYDDLDGPTRARYLSNIIDEVDRLKRLIHDLLDLSKIEAGRNEWKMAPVELAALARGTVERLESVARETGVSLVLEAPGPLPLVLADTDRIVQVMTNLVGNALKFTESGGRVVVRLTPHATGVRIAVEDTGIGIPAAQQAAIFDKFVQVKRAGGDAVGTGLGLPISREIVEAHLGEISVTSEPGRGTTFAFTLPGCAGKSPFEAYLDWRVGYARITGEPFAILLFGFAADDAPEEARRALRRALADALRSSDAVVEHDRSTRVAAFVSVDREQQQPLMERLRTGLMGHAAIAAVLGEPPGLGCVAARFPDQAESALGLRALLESRR